MTTPFIYSVLILWSVGRVNKFSAGCLSHKLLGKIFCNPGWWKNTMFTCLASARLKNVTRWVRRSADDCSSNFLYSSASRDGAVCIRVHGCHQRIIAGHSQQGFSATHTLTFTTAAVQLPLLRDYVSQLCSIQLSQGGGLPTMAEAGLQCDRSGNCLEIYSR